MKNDFVSQYYLGIIWGIVSMFVGREFCLLPIEMLYELEK